MGYPRFCPEPTAWRSRYGGGEANAAVSLANFGDWKRAIVTKLPEAIALGQCAVNALRYFGVDTSEIVRGGDRGWACTILEKGASQRGSKVHLRPRRTRPSQLAGRGGLRLGPRFSTARTGSTSPASPPRWAASSRRDLRGRAARRRRRRALTVSCDLNYRGKLWTRRAGAARP